MIVGHSPGLTLRVCAWLCCMLLAGLAMAAQDAQPVFDADSAYRGSQAAIGRMLPDLELKRADGGVLRLADLHGQPLVISLIYSSCYQVCPMTTRALERAVRAARSVLGESSFTVLTLGFDAPVDTPAAMREFAAKQGVQAEHWYFVSADVATVAAFAQAIGFTYQASPKGFDHLLQTTVVDADGRVATQIYGEVFDPPLLVEPLKHLIFRTDPGQSVITQVINRVKLFCVTYDPASGGYRYDYSLFIGMAVGASIIGSVFVFLVRETRRPRQS